MARGARPGLASDPLIRACAALLFAALLAGCTAPPPVAATATPTSSAPVAVEITDSTRGELQAALQTQQTALTRRDLTGYQATFDGQRAGLRRCKQESFDIAGRQGASGTAPRVVRVDPQPYATVYVRAWVDEGGRGLARLYFRQIDGKWVQSEPTERELGAEKTMTFDGVDVDYWEIDADVVQALGRGTLAARDVILQNLLSEVRKPFGIRFYPTRSSQPVGLQCNVVGFHIPNAPADDKYIRFFRYWFTEDASILTPSTVTFIQHEGLHWAQDQFHAGITARLDWWLIEGWPDYVGQSRAASEKRSVVCGFPAPAYKQLADGPRSDLPETTPEEEVRYYSWANTMIEYLYERFGSDSYKKLLVAYIDDADPNHNLPAVLNATPEEFRTGWIAWSKQKYC